MGDTHWVRRIWRLGSLLLFFLLATEPADAQQTGTITGRVIGPDAGPVPGATIAVRGTALSTRSDGAGSFRLERVPTGAQSLSVDHPGFQTATLALTIGAGSIAAVEVRLDLAAVALAGITVEGERGGQIRAAQQERRSATLMEVVSADEIGTLPDQNVAEAVQRVSGVFMETSRGEGRTVSIRGVAPNLNNVTMNGQPLASTAADRATALDLLPASMVASIEVIKAVTPDMDANTIGGTINLRTLTAFDRPGPFLTGSAEGLIHDRQLQYGEERTPFELDLTAGRRFGRDEQFGIVLSGSASRRDNSVSVLDPDGWIRAENALDPTGDSLTVSNEIELQVADNDRDRLGLSGGLDWRPDDQTNLFARGLFSRTEERELNSEFEITFTGDFEFTTPTAGRNTRGSMELDLSQEDEEEKLYTVSLGGDRRMGPVTLDATALITRGVSWREGPDATFQNPRATESQSPLRLDFDPYFFSVTPENPGFVGNPAIYNLDGLGYDTRQTVEDTRVGALDLQWDTHLAGFPAFLKVGGKLQSRDKEIDEASESFEDAAGLNLSLWSLPAVGGLQGAAAPFVHGDVPGFAAWVLRNRVGSDSIAVDPFETAIGEIEGDAYVRERITAGYLMGNAQLGRLSVLTGLRMERTDTDAEFWELVENSELDDEERYDLPEERSRLTNDYTHWLPAAVLKLDASDRLVLRGAFTSTMGRPQYTQLARYTEANYLPDPEDPNVFEGSVSAANPELRAYESSNFDLSAELYFTSGGQLSAGGFYKRVANPIYTFVSTERDIDYQGRFFRELDYSQLRNGDAGSFRGIEFAYAQPFYFLPGMLNGLGITANLALIDSELEVEGRDDRLPFIGQPDRVINLIPYFQRGPFEARFAYARRSDYLVAVEEPGLDRFVDSRETMDLTLRYRLAGRGLEMIATGRNLANAPEVRYQGTRDHYDLHVLTGRTFSLGLRTTH